MTTINRPSRSKRMALVAATAGTFVLGSAGVAFASTHNSSGTRVGARPSIESSTSVGDTSTSVESPTAPVLETKTFATKGGTVVVQIDHTNHRVTLVSATPAEGWTVTSHVPNPRGHGFVDVRFRTVTATDPAATSTTDDSGHHGDDDTASTGTEIRVRVGFAAARLVESVTTRTFAAHVRPVAETSTTTESSLAATSTTVDDDADDDQGDDNGKHEAGEHHRGQGNDDTQADDKGGHGNDDPATHDQADDHGGRGQGGSGDGGGNGGNRGSGSGGGDDHGGDRGGNGGGGDDHGGRDG